jgi:hypothetical protein
MLAQAPEHCRRNRRWAQNPILAPAEEKRAFFRPQRFCEKPASAFSHAALGLDRDA